LHSLLRLTTITVGVFELIYRQGTARRILATFVALLVVSFALQAAGHWHAKAYEDHHCRVCHLAHSATVDMDQATALPAPDPAIRATRAEAVDPYLAPVLPQISSRAPPA